MKSSRKNARRLILGMSVEDAQSKFDSTESRLMLRLAHERLNQGVLHELQLAQHARNALPAERKCNITRFVKPTCKGFQAYIKAEPDDFVVRELWEKPSEKLDGESETLPAPLAAVTLKSELIPSSKVQQELNVFTKQKKKILTTLQEAAEVVEENVLSELEERRESGSLISGKQKSVVDRLVDTVEEAKDKGYRTLSSSSHLLEPVEMSLTLYSKKDKDIAEAFKSANVAFPAREGDISFSLWVSGSLLASEKLIKEFPFHLAKYVMDENDDGGHHPNRLPKVLIEVYFSAELYQISQLVGEEGTAAVRRFIGNIMMKQHEPTPTSQSILLNSTEQERQLFNLYDASAPEQVEVPWIQKTKNKVATLSGVVLGSEEVAIPGVTVEKMREAVSLVWKAWGHLIKDLHVYGDLDFLYLSIDRYKEAKESSEYIQNVRVLDEKINNETLPANQNSLTVGSEGKGKKGKHELVSPVNSHHKMLSKRKEQHFIPLSAEFTVIECTLERKGLPHNMVVEDITKTLTEMQTQNLEMLRLALLDELEMAGDGELDLSTLVPVLYAPKIVVTHAGVIERGSHSFQKIRIRGSCLAHVQALIHALNSENYFTDNEMLIAPGTAARASRLMDLPENLTFLNKRASHVGSGGSGSSSDRQKRLIGHRLRTSQRGGAGHSRVQVTQAFEERIVSQEERDFWRENYYCLSGAQLLYHNRIDAADALVAKNLNPRLSEHIRVINSKLFGDDPDGAEGSAESDSNAEYKPRRATVNRRGKKNLNLDTIAPERMFEYLCTDCEAETARWDLHIGDCNGYNYQVRLRKIPAKDLELVRPAVNTLRSKGFINYFGPNRFATYTKLNMHPGLHLLKGEFRAAANVIVQQFYLDQAMEAERKRTGNMFPSGNRHLPRMADISSHGFGKRSIHEHGTALQQVLNNALQASLMLNDQRTADGQLVPSPYGLDDPCAEAFLNVVGVNACRILVHEFLSFVWNDIVNQRMKRYGTFAVLPGDIVRRKTEVPVADAEQALLDIKEVRQNPNELIFVSQKDIEEKLYSPFDVMLPVPGANCILPENHTTDLYVVTLRRYGINFNPEDRQWDLFYGKLEDNDAAEGNSASSRRKRPTLSNTSPYHDLTTSFGVIEEELANETVFNDTLVSDKVLAVDAYKSRGGRKGPTGDVTDVNGVNAAMWRKDLRKVNGNSLGVTVEANYRAPLVNISSSLSWHLESGFKGTPLQRWGLRRHQELTDSALSSALRITAGPDAYLPPPSTIKTAAAEGEAKMKMDPEVLNPFALPNGHELITGVKEEAPANMLQKRDHQQSTNASLEAKRRGALAAASLTYDRPKRRYRTLPLPKTPYWVSSNTNSFLELSFALPAGSYSAMLLRELTKSDVNTSDVLPIDYVQSTSQTASGKATSALLHQQRLRETQYQRYMASRRHKRARFDRAPRAMNLALIHQQIFRSNGVRQSLIPTLRSYDSVAK